ncbi:MAG: sodium:calcium antiporter [Promethearchaeota archaeon]
MIVLLLAIFILVGGIALIIFSSKFAVKHSAMLATALGISPLIIGVTLVSIGTDISEIFNSIISCSLGHGDIDVGDSVGSDLTQLTLIFGILPIVCGAFHIKRRDIIILGSCEVLSLIVIFSIVEKGFITRLNAIFMVFSLIIYFWLIYNSNKESIHHRIEKLEISQPTKKKTYHFSLAVIGFVGVTISSYAIVQSIIYISQTINIHEYIISFVVLAVGTSLPELVVDINALRCGQHSIAIGDIVGSCIVDSTLSIGIGQIMFPTSVTKEYVLPTVLYTLIASIIVIVTIALRQKMDKKVGVFFISLYLIAYILIFNIVV